MTWAEFPETSVLLRVTAALVSVATAVVAAEYLSLRREFRSNGAFGPEVAAMRGVGASTPRPLRYLYRAVPTTVLMCLLLAASLSVLGHALAGALSAPSLVALALCLLARNHRIGFGGDGGDQMSTVIVLPLAACSLWPDPAGLVVKASLTFIALQSTLSYITAGVAKLCSPQWRAGSAMFEIISTVTHGLPELTTLFRRSPRLGRVASWAVVLMECTFPAIIFLPPEAAVVLLAVFTGFHLGIARVMGLNTFVWTFAASYPAVLWLNGELRGAWSGLFSEWFAQVAAIAMGPTPRLLVHLVGSALAAKVFVEGIASLLGERARGRSGEIVAFVVLFLVSWQFPSAMLVGAFGLRFLTTLQRRVVGSANHPFLELLLLSVLLFGSIPDAALVAFLQVVVVSVWVYAAVQKALSSEIWNGLFFYRFFAGHRHMHPSQRWLLRDPLPLPDGMPGNFGRLEPRALTCARIAGVIVVLGELLLPPAALLGAGSGASVVVMSALALVSGLIAREWSFMVTNLVLATLFLQPFDATDLATALARPLLVGLGLWFLLWPPVHVLLARWLRYSPWRLFGWGMYSKLPPIVRALSSGGDPLPARQNLDERSVLGRVLMEGFAVCRIPGLAAWAQRAYQCWSCDQPIAAFELVSYTCRDGRYGTRHTLLPRTDHRPWSDALCWEIFNEESAARYERARAEWLSNPAREAGTDLPRTAIA